jgi:hypothetical protein
MLLLICPRCLAFVGLDNFFQGVSRSFVGRSRRWCVAQIHRMEGAFGGSSLFLVVQGMMAQDVIN